jgi:uncharacterized OB-fold protein
MTAGVTVSACASCEWKGLPERLWCPRCGAERITTFQARAGTLEEITVARRASPAGPPVRVATVRIEGGGALIVRLESDLPEGALVELDDDEGAPVARAPGARHG